MAHYVNISGGLIEITPSIVRNADGPATTFVVEKDAATFLASAILETGVVDVQGSSSCDYPEDDGRPDFDMSGFMDAVARAMTTTH